METVTNLFANDTRTVLTLDAGGTNFVFSAMKGGVEIVPPITLPSQSAQLDLCLGNLVKGFEAVLEKLTEKPVAISFAFPGPADYQVGIIGDLPNFPSFRGGVPLKAYLEAHFGIPVFINNDGNLFAYGEALAGALPQLNTRLAQAGSNKQYKHLLGITFGTGFGAGVVINGELLQGDNGIGGDIWCFRNKKYPHCIAEESVSIRAVKRVYKEVSGDDSELTPKDIFMIAEGKQEGNREAALQAFRELGEMAGDAIAQAITIVDGIVVIGGGLAGAAKYIVPALVNEMNSSLGTLKGDSFSRLQMKVFDLTDNTQFEAFAKGESTRIPVPGTQQMVDYDPFKRVGVMVSELGASRAIALGAYVYALSKIG